MNIFYTASLRGKAHYLKNYKKIYDELSRENSVFAEHILTLDINQVSNWEPEYRFDYYMQILNKIKDCDLFVAELTTHSINVEYEVSLALNLRKNIIIFYLEGVDVKINNILDFITEKDNVQIIPYSEKDVEKLVSFVLKKMKSNISKRFTILLPPRIVSFLEKTSRESSLPISVYIRGLIEDKMKK